MLPANVAVRILQVNLAQVSLSSISIDMLPYLLHVVVIHICAKSDSTLKANASVPALHQDSVRGHVTADQTLCWLVIFVYTCLLTFNNIVFKLHPALLAYVKL